METYRPTVPGGGGVMAARPLGDQSAIARLLRRMPQEASTPPNPTPGLRFHEPRPPTPTFGSMKTLTAGLTPAEEQALAQQAAAKQAGMARAPLVRAAELLK